MLLKGIWRGRSMQDAPAKPFDWSDRVGDEDGPIRGWGRGVVTEQLRSQLPNPRPRPHSRLYVTV